MNFTEQAMWKCKASAFEEEVAASCDLIICHQLEMWQSKFTFGFSVCIRKLKS